MTLSKPARVLVKLFRDFVGVEESVYPLRNSKVMRYSILVRDQGPGVVPRRNETESRVIVRLYIDILF